MQAEMSADFRQPAPKPLTLTIASDPLSVRDGLRELMQSPQLDWISATGRSATEIVLAEALNNIVEHAYAGQAGTIVISIHQAETFLRVRITDRGTALPDEGMPDGCLPALCHANDLPEGGFGWHLIRTLATGLSYSRIDGENHLCFKVPLEERQNCAGKPM